MSTSGALPILVGLIAAAAALCAPFHAASADPEPPRAGFVFVNWSDPKTLDPQEMTGQIEGRIADAIYEGLTRRDAATLRPVPGQAESWDVSPDGRRFTFHLRSMARWSNGEPVTAHDFVAAWVRLQDPVMASEYAYLLHVVRHARAFNVGESDVATLVGDPHADDAVGKEGLIHGLSVLLAGHRGELDARDWQQFLGERSRADVLTRTKDPIVREALGKTRGTMSAAEGRTLLAALSSDAERRAAELGAARAHFGKDEGVFAPDDRTFVVELESFAPYFLELTSFYVTYPVHRKTVETWERDAFAFPGRLVTNGPFRLDQWTRGKSIRLRKSPDYWGAADVALESVEALSIGDRGAALELFQSGAIDWAPSGIPWDRIDEAKRMPAYYANPGMIDYFFRLNCTRPPFDDPRVRKAVGLAIDRETIVEQLTRGGQVPATNIVPAGMPGYESPPSGLGYDVEAARRLLADAGYPAGKGFPKITLLYNTDEVHRKIAKYVAASLNTNLGVDAEAVNTEWQSMLERVQRLDYDMVRGAWIGDYRDPETFLAMWVTGSPNNQTGWSDSRYDRLMRLASDPASIAKVPAAERDDLLAHLKERAPFEAALAALAAVGDAGPRFAPTAALRTRLLREAEAILIQDEFPVLPVYDYAVSGLVSPRVEGFYWQIRRDDGTSAPNVEDLHPLRDVRVRKR